MSRSGSISNKPTSLNTHAHPQWLMSLRSVYAQRILSGDKRYEFRRVRMQAKAGETVLIYESHPTRLVTGCFTVGAGSRWGISVGEALKLEKSGAARADLAEYLAGATCVTALEVIDPVRLDRPLSLLDATGLARGPMSYCRLAEIVIEAGGRASR
jgi:predicted transcriptional regulator